MPGGIGNRSGFDLMAQRWEKHIWPRSPFLQSHIHPQFDHVRAFGEDVIRMLPERTQQLLGYYTRIPTSLDEYYRTESERLYRKHQG